jgi:hypothetical protein
MAIFLLFLALQCCDAATTMVFLRHGIAEGNPLIAAAIRASTHPGLTLVWIKAAACALALFAWKTRRLTLLRRANVFFALCVVWNVAALCTA